MTGLKKYLGSGLIKGIGPAYAKRIIALFGVDTLNVIDQNPKRLSEVPGIGKKTADRLMIELPDRLKEIATNNWSVLFDEPLPEIPAQA